MNKNKNLIGTLASGSWISKYKENMITQKYKTQIEYKRRIW